MHTEYVACIRWQGEKYSSAPNPDRVAMERAAQEAEGWVEEVKVYDLAETSSLHLQIVK